MCVLRAQHAQDGDTEWALDTVRLQAAVFAAPLIKLNACVSSLRRRTLRSRRALVGMNTRGSHAFIARMTDGCKHGHATICFACVIACHDLQA